jgi:hypothetical protein
MNCSPYREDNFLLALRVSLPAQCLPVSRQLSTGYRTQIITHSYSGMFVMLSGLTAEFFMPNPLSHHQRRDSGARLCIKMPACLEKKRKG